MAARRRGILLAAGLGSRVGLAARGGNKALLAVNDEPAIAQIVRTMRENNVNFITVVVPPGQVATMFAQLDAILENSGVDYDVVVQETPSGPADALRAAGPSSEYETVILLLADTYLAGSPVVEPDAVGVSKTFAGPHYCFVECDDQDAIVRLVDKPQESPVDGLALVGIYHFGSPGVLDEALARNDDGELRSTLETYLTQRTLQAVSVEGWYDLGNFASYTEATRTLVSGREFHRFAVTESGWLQKSGNPALIRNEAEWYGSLSPRATHLVPRTQAMYLNAPGDQASLLVEMQDSPTLAQIAVHEVLDLPTWQFISQRIVSDLRAAFWSQVTAEPGAEWREDRYVGKTLRRLQAWPEFERLQKSPVRLNGALLPSFEQVWPAAGRILKAHFGDSPLVAVHGDPTFSNILFSRTYGFARYIDPTSSAGGIGDAEYDLAKLRQCYHGGYDRLARGHYRINEFESGNFELTLYGRQLEVATAAFDQECVSGGYDLQVVRILEALQFISMVPLHHESPSRQFAMYLRGVSFIESALDV